MSQDWLDLAKLLEPFDDVIIAKMDSDENEVDRYFLPERFVPNLKVFTTFCVSSALIAFLERGNMFAICSDESIRSLLLLSRRGEEECSLLLLWQRHPWESPRQFTRGRCQSHCYFPVFRIATDIPEEKIPSYLTQKNLSNSFLFSFLALLKASRKRTFTAFHFTLSSLSTRINSANFSVVDTCKD